MRGYSTSSVFVSACAGMAFFGVAMLSLAPILGQLNGIVDGANGLPSTMSLGILLGTIVFGPVVDRFGYKWLLALSSVLALAGLQGLANFREIGMLHLSIFCLGIGGGILNGETNALVSDIYDDDKRGGRLGLLGAFYCVGALLWTLLNYFIVDFTITLNAVSAVMAAFIVFFVFTRFPAAKPSENVSMRKTAGLLRYPALILFAVILFFESGFEGAQGNFTVSSCRSDAAPSLLRERFCGLPFDDSDRIWSRRDLSCHSQLHRRSLPGAVRHGDLDCVVHCAAGAVHFQQIDRSRF